MIICLVIEMTEKKKSLKPIPPTLRGKKRYVKFEFVSKSSLNENDVKRTIWNVFQNIFGERGIADQKLWLIKWSQNNNTGILRCNLKEEENVKAGLLFIQTIANEPVLPVILSVSGS